MPKGENKLLFQQFCKEKTSLSIEEILQLEQIAVTMQYTADLTGSDVFIDCMDKTGQTAVVVAHAKPEGDLSAYGKTVLGQIALPENEPAVYYTFRTGLGVHDLKAVTQENVAVRQDVAPVKNKDGRVIGVLIREKDVSNTLRLEEKYIELAREHESRIDTELHIESPEVRRVELQMREIHHRVKNNLQLVASILNIQARKLADPQMRQILKENVGKVLSIGAIHDILTLSGGDDIDLLQLLEKIRRSIQSLSVKGKNIRIEIEGDRVIVPSTKASSIALVVHELILNAFEHAFVSKQKGLITILLRCGNSYSSIVVEDNGNGMEPDILRNGGLGFELISTIVRDTLGGEIRYHTGKFGTKVMFNFK